MGGLACPRGPRACAACGFPEGSDPIAAYAFKQVAHLSNGAYCGFDSSSAHMLKDLLGAVAVFAAGGRLALEDMARERGGEVLKIAHQVGSKGT